MSELVTQPCEPPSKLAEVFQSAGNNLPESMRLRLAQFASDIEASNQSLRAAYDTLSSRAKTLEARFTAFNSSKKCATPANSSEAASCAAEKRPLVSDWVDYEVARRAYEKTRGEREVDAARALDDRGTEIAARGPQTRQLLLGIPRANAAWARDVEDWTSLQSKARAEAVKNATENLLEQGAVGALAGLHARKEYSEAIWKESIPRAEAWYESMGQVFPPAQRTQALMVIHSMKSDADWLQLIHIAKAALDVAYENLRDDVEPSEEAKLSLLAEANFGLLDIVQTETPAVMLYHNARTLFVDVGYGWAASLVVKRRVSELITLQAQGLIDANRVSQLYVDDINTQKIIPKLKDRMKAIHAACPAAKKGNH